MASDRELNRPFKLQPMRAYDAINRQVRLWDPLLDAALDRREIPLVQLKRIRAAVGSGVRNSEWFLLGSQVFVLVLGAIHILQLISAGQSPWKVVVRLVLCIGILGTIWYYARCRRAN